MVFKCQILSNSISNSFGFRSCFFQRNAAVLFVKTNAELAVSQFNSVMAEDVIAPAFQNRIILILKSGQSFQIIIRGNELGNNALFLTADF